MLLEVTSKSQEFKWKKMHRWLVVLAKNASWFRKLAWNTGRLKRKGYSRIPIEWTHSGQIGAQIFLCPDHCIYIFLVWMDGWYGMKVANAESWCDSRCWQLPPLQIWIWVLGMQRWLIFGSNDFLVYPWMSVSSPANSSWHLRKASSLHCPEMAGFSFL